MKVFGASKALFSSPLAHCLAESSSTAAKLKEPNFRFAYFEKDAFIDFPSLFGTMPPPLAGFSLPHQVIGILVNLCIVRCKCNMDDLLSRSVNKQDFRGTALILLMDSTKLSYLFINGSLLNFSTPLLLFQYASL